MQCSPPNHRTVRSSPSQGPPPQGTAGLSGGAGALLWALVLSRGVAGSSSWHSSARSARQREGGRRAWEPTPANPALSSLAILSLLIKHPRNIKFTDTFSSPSSWRHPPKHRQGGPGATGHFAGDGERDRGGAPGPGLGQEAGGSQGRGGLGRWEMPGGGCGPLQAWSLGRRGTSQVHGIGPGSWAAIAA